MKRSVVCALLLACFLLTGCGSMLERSYSSETPHVQFFNEGDSRSILRAENYQGLVSALLHLVNKGEKSGTVRLYQYASVSGSAASDVDRACLEITQKDPMGVYGVDYIKYDVEQTSSYYEVSVKLAYTRPKEEITGVISVTGSTAVAQELHSLLPERPERVVFRIGYFSREESADSLRQSVLEACSEESLHLPDLLEVQVNLYPDSGQQRVAEILFTWAEPTLPLPSESF